MSVLLEAREVAKSYGDTAALLPLRLEVGEGELVVLVGHNGAGKSTFTNLAAGLLEPTSGSILIAGSPAGSYPARAHLSYLADTPSLYDDLSVWEHARYISAMHEFDDWTARYEELLERLQLTERSDGLPSRFSRGLRQKTCILLGLLRPLSLLIADEPFVGLDAGGREAFTELIAETAQAGASVIVSTHQLELIEKADRCIALRDGVLIFDGPARDADVDDLVSA
jgi:ABC-2 type transport system ATP-binding protein/Cu-processing system ATP-binding protein